MKKSAIVFFLLSFTINSWCQNTEDPPPVASPPKENIPLIDELIRVSGMENSFKEYCYKKIEEAAKKNNWDASMTEAGKSKVNFADFKEYSVYNAFTFVTAAQIKKMTKLIKELNNESRVNDFFLMDSMILNNLEIFVKRYTDK